MQSHPPNDSHPETHPGSPPTPDLLYSARSLSVYREYHARLQRTVIRKTVSGAFSKRKLKCLERDFALTQLVYQNTKGSEVVSEPLLLERNAFSNELSFIMDDSKAPPLRSYITNPHKLHSLSQIDNFLTFAINACSALDTLHRHCLVLHCDIKPENLLLVPDSFKVKFIDFGVSTVVSAKKPFRHVHSFFGSYQYCPPEQTGRTKAAVSFGTDLYSLGIVFYEILSGNTPFHDQTSPLEILHAHTSKELPRLHNIPHNLWKVISEMLRKDIHDRYQTAFGVLKDLQLLQQLANAGNIDSPDFVCAKSDMLCMFRFPDHLYGREDAVSRIEQLVQKARRRSQLAFIRGESGVGKSSVVMHALSVFSDQTNHLFVSAKSDQFQKGSVPYSPIIQILKKLVKLAHSTFDNHSLDALKRRLHANLGSNVQLLKEFVEETSELLGPENHFVTPLDDSNLIKDRFVQSIVSFIISFAADHHLSIFFDDVQWMDSSSLEIVKKLVLNGDYPLFVVGCYRSNEVDASHTLQLTLNELEGQVDVEKIELNCLTPHDIAHFIADTLHLPYSECVSLADCIHKKTEGNPFFSREFLSSMHEQSIISFDSNQARWVWDEEALPSLRMASNVVDLMIQKLRTKPKLSIRILGIASIVGSKFSLHELQKEMCDISEEELQKALYKLSQEGWIQEVQDANVVTFKFSHDRFQQSSLELIEKEERAQIHLRLGWKIVDAFDDVASLSERQLFHAVNHLNNARHIISVSNDKGQKQKLLHLNYHAAVKAHKSAAFEAAKSYASTAISLLPSDLWSTMHTKVNLTYSQALFALSEHDEAEQVLETTARSCENESDSYLIQSDLINLLLGVHKTEKAFSTTVDIFQVKGSIAHQYLGDMPIEGEEEIRRWLETKKQFIDEKLTSIHSSQDIERLVRRGGSMKPTLPEYAFQKMASMAVPMMVVSNQSSQLHISCLALSGLECALDHGTSIFTSFFLNWTSFTYSVIFKDYERAVMFYHAGNTLMRSPEYKSNEVMIASLNCLAFDSVFVDTSRLVDAHESEGLLMAFESNSFSWGSYFVCHSTTFKFIHGHNFKSILADGSTQRDFLLKGKAQFYVDVTECIWALCRFLMLKDETLSFHFAGNSYEGYTSVRSIRMILALCEMIGSYLTDDASGLLQITKRYLQHQNDLVGLPQNYMGHFFLGLAYSLILENPNEIGNLKDLLQKYESHMTILEEWKEANEKYFGSIYHLNQAEYLRSVALVTDQSPENSLIMKHYNTAINLSREYPNDLVRALSYEKAGLYARNLPEYLDDTVAFYLQSAVNTYSHLDAHRKVESLRRMCPRYLLLNTRRRNSSHLVSRNPVIPPPLPANRFSMTMTSDGSWNELDLESIMKMSHSISRESLSFERLTKKSLDILLQSIGAQRGILLLVDPDSSSDDEAASLKVRAEYSIDFEEVILHGSDSSVPYCQLIVEDTLSKRETVIVDNAISHRVYSKDEYVQERKLKSLICTPISYQQKMLGLFLAEHSDIEGVFGADSRLFFTGYLIQQFAIALTNSRLYTHLERTNEAYNRFVPNEFLDLLGAKQIWNIKCGDAQAMENMTICFLDIRDWTRKVEHLSPYEAFSMINQVWHHINPLVFKNNGIIDKVLGDAVLSLFPKETSCLDAVRCAIDITQVLKENLDVRIGIGIHRGPTILGTVGNDNRLDTTVIGDTVNTASRLESITKALGVSVLISFEVYRYLPFEITRKFYEVGTFLLKGKTSPMTLYALKNENKSISKKFSQALAQFEEGNVKKAAPIFKSLSESHPLSKYYHRLCRTYSKVKINSDGAILVDKDGNPKYKIVSSAERKASPRKKSLAATRSAYAMPPRRQSSSQPSKTSHAQKSQSARYRPRGSFSDHQLLWNSETKTYERVKKDSKKRR